MSTSRASSGAASLQFAPFGALRVAAWPLRALDAFGCPELLEAAAQHVHGRATGAVEELYRERLAAERAALWAQTAGDERFMKALALANPALLQRVRERSASAGTSTPDKRTRHLETTLYRLLARAVGRTEPFGAWSGVGIVELGAETRLERVPVQRVAAPDLAFHSAVLRTLSANRAVARLAQYRVNPTLGRRCAGGWGFWAPPRVAAEGYCQLPEHPLLDLALQRLCELGTFTIEHAEHALEVEPGQLDGFFFEQLLPQGLLVGGLSLPPFFSDAWDALERIEAELPLPQPSAWAQLRLDLHALCQRVEQQYETASHELLMAAHEEARVLTRRFGAQLQLTELPELALYLDSGAPWRLTLGPGFVADLTRGVALDEADISGPVRAFNEALRRAQCERVGAAGLPVSGLPEDCLVELSRVQERPPVPPSQYFPDWPLRTAIADIAVGPLRTGAGGGARLGSLNLVDDVACALSRFFPVLQRQDEAAARALLGWLCTAHAAVQPPLAALSEGEASAPNALAQPDLGLPRFSLWSVAAGVRSLADLRVSARAERGLLTLSGAAEEYSLVSLCSANLLRGDPALQLLMMSSLRLPRPPLRAAAACAQSAPPSTDPQRMSATALAALARRQGFERFVAWAAARGPHRGRQLVERPGTSPLLVSVDSPLAVAAALEGVSASWQFLHFQAATELPYLSDGEERYVARLVLPFRRKAPAPGDLPGV